MILINLPRSKNGKRLPVLLIAIEGFITNYEIGFFSLAILQNGYFLHKSLEVIDESALQNCYLIFYLSKFIRLKKKILKQKNI